MSQPLVFSQTDPSYAVDFTVFGKGVANVEVLPGDEKAILHLSEELATSVHPRGNATGPVDVLLSNSGTIGSLLGIVVTLLSQIINLLGGVLGLLSPSIKAILNSITNALDRLKHLGEVNFENPITSEGPVLYSEYRATLISTIVADLTDILSGLTSDIKSLQTNCSSIFVNGHSFSKKFLLFLTFIYRYL